jgi:hypothetical protein
VRNGGLPLLLEVEVPEEMIYERDNESWAEQDEGSANVLAPVGVDAVNGDGGIKREGEAENLEEKSQRHLRAPFEKAAEGKGKKVGEDERDGGGDRALRANEGLDHRHSILRINGRRNKGDGLRQGPNFADTFPTRHTGSKPRIARKTGRRPVF